jgi:hypothetical protein
VWFLLKSTGATDQQWTRFTYVFAAVQNISLLAATFFFGKTISTEQQKTATAESKAKTAAKDLTDLAERAERLVGRASQPSIDNALQTFERITPNLSAHVPAFADHLRVTTLRNLPDYNRDLEEIATKARQYATEVNTTV